LAKASSMVQRQRMQALKQGTTVYKTLTVGG